MLRCESRKQVEAKREIARGLYPVYAIQALQIASSVPVKACV